jgi:hypothetical protein
LPDGAARGIRPRQIVSKIAQAQLRSGIGFRIRELRPRHSVSRLSEIMLLRGMTPTVGTANWDRHHSHFHHGKVFVFIGGLWWGLDPWLYPYYAYDYYPYSDYGDYGYDPYDYSYGYPYDYSADPYDYYNYSPYNNDDQSGYAESGQSAANTTVSAVQAELAKLGYYNGTIDGTVGDETEAALARYQQDRDLSVTGTTDAATLQSLGIR